MSENSVSSTAHWTAAVRAKESERADSLFNDPWAAALAGRLYLYLGAIPFGLIGLASEGQTLSGIYQQLKDFRAKGKASVE